MIASCERHYSTQQGGFAMLQQTRPYARSCLTDGPEEVVRGCCDALQLYGVRP